MWKWILSNLGAGWLAFQLAKANIQAFPFGAYSELDWNREVVYACLFRNSITSKDARKVDKGRFNNALLALDGFDNFLRKAIIGFISVCRIYEALEHTGSQHRPLTGSQIRRRPWLSPPRHPQTGHLH